MKVTTMLVMMFFYQLAFGESSMKPSEKSSEMVVEIQMGNQKTRFVANKASKILSMHSSSGYKRNRKISKKDFQFLVQKVDSLPMVKNLAGECLRSRIQISLSRGKKTVSKKESCFGLPSITAKSYQDFANFLVSSL